MIRKRTLIFITVISIMLSLSGCSSNVPKAQIYSWMYDMTKSVSDLRSIIPGLDGSYSVYDAHDFELIEGIKGELCIRTTDGCLDNWTWTRYIDDDTYKTIKKSLAKAFSTNKSSDRFSDDGIDEAILYKTINFEKGTYSPDWTINDVPIEEAMSESEILEKEHMLLLLKKGDFISIQYDPINQYNSLFGSITWHPNDFD